HSILPRPSARMGERVHEKGPEGRGRAVQLWCTTDRDSDPGNAGASGEEAIGVGCDGRPVHQFARSQCAAGLFTPQGMGNLSAYCSATSAPSRSLLPSKMPTG